MKRLLLILLVLPALVMAQEPETLVHNSRLYVDDYADLYTDQQELELDGIIRKFFDTAQISIVTIKSFGDNDPSDYCLRLGRKWGVGGQSHTGLLMVIGVDDRRIQVATGYGLEGDLPDVTVVDLQREHAVPRFKEKQYFEGTRDLLNAYINELSPSAKALRAKEEQVRRERNKEAWDNFVEGFLYFLMIAAIGVLIALPFYFRWKKKKREREIREAAEEEQRRLAESRQEAEDYVKNVERIDYDALEKLYPNKVMSIKDYKSKVDNVKAQLQYPTAFDFGYLLSICYTLYSYITYVAPVYKESHSKSSGGSKKSSDDDDSYSSRSSSYSSNNSNNDSYSSGSSDSGGSGFGGGSFGGGGGGSNW